MIHGYSTNVLVLIPYDRLTERAAIISDTVIEVATLSGNTLIKIAKPFFARIWN